MLRVGSGTALLVVFRNTLNDGCRAVLLIYLTAKETHIFNIHFIPETLIKFYPK